MYETQRFPLWQCFNPIDKTPIGGQGASPYSIIGERQTDSCTRWGNFCRKYMVLRNSVLALVGFTRALSTIKIWAQSTYFPRSLLRSKVFLKSEQPCTFGSPFSEPAGCHAGWLLDTAATHEKWRQIQTRTTVTNFSLWVVSMTYVTHLWLAPALSTHGREVPSFPLFIYAPLLWSCNSVIFNVKTNWCHKHDLEQICDSFPGPNSWKKSGCATSIIKSMTPWTNFAELRCFFEVVTLLQLTPG